MPPEIQTTEDVSTEAEPEEAPPAPAPALTPEAIRSSPEFKVLELQNRTLARQAGAAAREAEKARAEAERQRQAAEAQQQADLEAELATTLGEDGLAIYNEIAELSQSDPRAAAKQLAQLVAQARAQSSASPEVPAAPPATEQEGQVPPTTPPPPRGFGADASLSQPPRTEGDDYEAIAADLDKRYDDVVTRVQDPDLRNRVTMKDRAAGMISYVAASVLRGGARPSTK